MIGVARAAPRAADPASTAGLRVLFVVESTIAGVKRHTLDLLAGFAARGDLHVEVACPAVREDHGGDTSFLEDVRALGIPVHRVAMRRSIDPRSDGLAALQLARIVRRGRYDVVHLHSSKAGALGRLAVWLAHPTSPARRPRTVYTPNGWSFLIPGSPTRSRLYAAVERLLAPLTDRVIVVSEDERREALSRGVIAAHRTRLVRSGVDPARLPTPDDGERKRQEMGWGPRGRCVVVGSAARLTPQKDPATWLRAAARAAAERRDLRFVWIGHGEMEPEFLRLARELGLDGSGQLQYLGYRADARELIAALDVFTLSSVFEAGLPYVLMEAMMLERPVVAAAGSGSRELIQHGVDGWLVPPGDHPALADGILRLAADGEARDRIGRAGRAVVLASCTTDHQVDETRRVYGELLGAAGGARTRRAR